MATIIKIKRSSGIGQPNLGQGELGYSWGTGNYIDAQSATVTSYGKMYLGTGTETGGIAANIEVIGGKYFTDMLDHGHGTLTANSAVLVDSAKKVNEFYVDNLGLDGNTISSTNTDGDIVLDPNGVGEIQIPDDTYLTFGTSKDTKIRYNEATNDRLEVTGADWNFTSGVAVSISDTTVSSGVSSGALVVSGGVGIGGDLYVAGSFNVGLAGTPTNLTVSGDLTVQGGDVNFTDSATNFNLRDNIEGSLDIKQGIDSYLKINTTNSSELISIGNTLAKTSVEVLDNSLGAFQLKQNANVYIDVTTSNSVEKVSIGNNISAIDNIVKDNVASAFVVKESTNEYIKINTTNSSESLILGNNIASIKNNILNNASNAFSITEGLVNYLNITTINGSELIEIGNSIAKVNISVEDNTASAFLLAEGSNNYIKIDTTNSTELVTFGVANIDIDNNLNVDGGNFTTNQSTFNLLNANATTVNFAGAATAVEIGAATGTTNINNNLDVDGTISIDGGALNCSTSTFNLLNSNATTVNAFGNATTINFGTAATTTDFGDLKINGSTIYGDVSGQTITLDPYPAGGDAGGDVIVRGNFKVTGTTTTVNSTVMTVNDPIFTLGDAISEKVLTSSASNGATTLILDNTTGLNNGDIITGDANIPANTTIVVNTSNQITISAALTGGIAAGVTLTFTQGADDNMDRGIEYRYYNGSLKTGFFGYDESGISEDVTTYYFTYIPDATNSGNVFNGTRGSAYFKTVKLDDGVLNGVAFFDQYKRLTRTVAAGTSDETTSNQILTVNGSGVPVWTTTLDGGTY
jgi:hypothetical protein